MSQRILLFDADAGFAQDMRSKFEAMGATVDVANDGQQGIELATAHRPDLILLTIELPGMNGFLVCKKLKKQDGLSDVPLFILSSEATEDVFEQHRKLRTRAEDYIHKPIAFADLLERVKRFMPLEGNGHSAADADDAMESRTSRRKKSFSSKATPRSRKKTSRRPTVRIHPKPRRSRTPRSTS